jgi:chromosome segregation ATPase
MVFLISASRLDAAEGPSVPQEIQQKQSEVRSQISHADQQIDALNLKIDDQNEKIDQLQAVLDDQWARVVDLSRQSAQLQAQAQTLRLQEQVASRQAAVDRNVRITQLKAQTAAQLTIVNELAEKVRQENQSGMVVDEFDQDRANLQAQQQTLSDLQNQLSATQADADVGQSTQTADLVARERENAVASQAIAAQLSAATAAYDKQQTALSAARDQEQALRSQLELLEAQRQTAIDELADLTSRQ